MEDNDIITHIATRIMGWKDLGTVEGGRIKFSWWKDGEPVRGGDWNPLADLNACAEFEAKLADRVTERGAYLKELSSLTGRCSWGLVTATPRQRCMAAVEATK